MKIRITDIPSEGCHVDFELDRAQVNRRATPDLHPGETAKKDHPDWDCRFEENPKSSLDLSLDGKTVRAIGQVSGDFIALCARCAETTKTSLESPIDVLLKPDAQKKREDEEEQDFEYYSGEEIDCSALAEEALMIAIPYVILCSENCQGLCSGCGANKNQGSCSCVVEASSTGKITPFSVLKDMKILQ